MAVLLMAAVAAIPVGVVLLADQDPPSPGVREAPSGPTASLGDEVRDGAITFEAESFSCRDDPGRPTPDAPPTQGCLLVLKGVNHSTAPAELFGRLQYVVDAAGRRYGPEEGIVEPFLEMLNPDEDGTLTLVFEVPAEARIEQLEVHSYPGSLGARIEVGTGTTEGT